MADDFRTSAEIDVSVTGSASLNKAADEAAKLENTLRNVAQAAGELAKTLDKSAAGAFNKANDRTAATARAAAAALEAQAKAQSSLNRAAAANPTTQARGPGGRFASGTDNTNKLAAVSSQLGFNLNDDTKLYQNSISEIKRAQEGLTAFDRKQNQIRLQDNLSYLKVQEKQTLASVQAQRKAIASAFGGKVAPGQNQSGAAGGAQMAGSTGITSTAYSLINLSFAIGLVSAGLFSIDKAAAKTAIDFQRDFANVARTTGVTSGVLYNGVTAADRLKQSLIELSQTIPVSFEEITNIATLAGQLDISASAVGDFSQTVAEFSATTNVGIEDAATSLGRLGQLLPDVDNNFKALGSSILKVGVTSVATESQIIAIATQIAGIGHAAGLSAPEIIGLSGALASLGIQPELARGTVTRLFTNIQIAIESTSTRLDDFGKITNQTGAQFAETWKSAPTTALLELLKGVEAQGDGATSALQGLGIASVRDIPALLRLAQNTQVLEQALKNAATGFNDQTELGKQFAIVAQTVSAKLQVMSNDWDAFLASIGNSSLTPLAGLIDGINALLVAMTKVASNPIGQVIAITALGFTGLIAVVTALVAALAVGTGTTLLFKSAMDSAAISARTATIALTATKVALWTTGIGAAVIALGALTAGLLESSGAFDKVGDKGKAFFGTLDTLAQGLEADQANYQRTGQALQQITVAMDGTTNAAKNSTVAYGENAQAALKSALASNEAFQALFSNKSVKAALTASGGNLNDFYKAIIGDPVKGGTDYVNKLKATIKSKLAAGDFGDAGTGATLVANSLLGALDRVGDVATGSSDALQGAAGAAAAFASTGNGAALAAGDLAAKTTDANGSVVELSKQLQDGIDELYSGVNAQQTLADSTEKLGEAFVNNGADVAASGSEIQQVISNILASSGTQQQAANAMQGFFDALVNGGYASSQQLIILQQVIASLGGATASTTFDMSAFTAGQNKARVAIQKTGGAAAKQIKTISGYASDLKGVMDDAFNFRFGSQKSLDDVTSQFQKMQQEVIDTNNDVRDLQNSLMKNLSDVGILQYFKQVADAYGDTLRSADLASQIADLNAKIADNSSDLAKAQAKQTKTTVGNSEAAIENRGSLLDLLDGYKDYIASLADSGLNQSQLAAATAQLKQQFIQQATQLGYNITEVQGYATAFDDLTTIINRIPRNITISGNTDPAQRAINEFMAANTGGRGASGGISVPVSIDAAKAARGFALQQEIARLLAEQAASRSPHSYDAPISYRINKLAAGNYADGGEIRGPGTTTSDSILANVSNKEFIVNADAAQRNLGLLNYLNRNGSLPGFTAGSSGRGAGISGIMQVALVAEDRRKLDNIADRIGNIEVEFVEVSKAAATGDKIIKNRGGR